ncbi:thiol:disulfide interchange protein DsbA/DsbL (plasmid) [Ralstonia pseudosolanacearum]
MKSIAAFILALATNIGCLTVAFAQPAPIAGKDYTLLQTPQPALPGKIEVIEFFGYWCPHCNRFQNTWEAWKAKQSKDVVIRQIPVDFNDARLVPYSRIYYALEAIGKLEARSRKGTPMHARLFDAIHGADRLSLPRDPAQQERVIADFMAGEGIDRKAFLDAYTAFGVNANARRANQLAKQYGVEGVPTVVVQGKYVVSPDEGGGYVSTLRTLDDLVRQVRGGKL